MSQCNEFVGMLFLARDVTHSAHLNTRSYAKHKALGKFYDDVIDAIDRLVEAYQGAFSLIGNIPAPKVTERDVLKLLEADAYWIEEHHEEICKGNRAVANLIDGVTEVYLTTVYKLRNLK